MSNPEKEQFNPEPTGEQYEKKEKAPEVPEVQKVIDIYKKYEKIVQDIEKKKQEVAELYNKKQTPKVQEAIAKHKQEVAELYNQGDELWEIIPDVFSDTLSFGEVYGRIEKIGGQMRRKNAERISAKETIRNIEEIRGALNTKESKEFFLKMDNEKKEGIFRFFSRSGGLRSKVIELIEQEIKRKTADSAEIPKTGEKVEGVKSKEKEAREIFKHLEKLLEQGADKDDIAQGLAGVGTPEAMALREKLLKQGAGKNYVAQGLAGVGTPEAMALRKELLKQGAGKKKSCQNKEII